MAEPDVLEALRARVTLNEHNPSLIKLLKDAIREIEELREENQMLENRCWDYGCGRY